LLAGLGLLAIPGLGPVVAAGWLASTALGAVAGGAAGGLIGALTAAGVSQEDAHVSAEGIRRGGTLVTASCTQNNSALDAGRRWREAAGPSSSQPREMIPCTVHRRTVRVLDLDPVPRGASRAYWRGPDASEDALKAHVEAGPETIYIHRRCGPRLRLDTFQSRRVEHHSPTTELGPGMTRPRRSRLRRHATRQ
jgi:hypothetical protein